MLPCIFWIPFQDLYLKLSFTANGFSGKSKLNPLKEDIKKKMLSWVEDKNYDNTDLAANNCISAGDKELLIRYTLKDIIGLYCEKDKKFSADHFRSQMKEVSVTAFAYNKIYGVREE